MNSILYQDSAQNSFRLSRISRIEAEVPFTGLGIKYVGSGREVYFANDRKYREEAGSYLIGNDFTRSIVHINQPEPVRGICIDISSQIIAEVVSSPVDSQSDLTGFLLSDQLLVNQYRTKNTGLGQCLEKIWRQLEAESHLQPAGEWLQEDLFYTLAEHIVSDQCLVFKHLHKLKFRKSGTKGEIMRSLLLAREYMDDQLAENPSLDEIAQVSGISKYHFIRLFREVFAVKLHAAYKNGSFPDSVSRIVRIGGPLIALSAIAADELETALSNSDSLSFSSVLVGDTLSRTFHVYNHGNQPLTINQVGFGGSSAWSYTLDSSSVNPGRKSVLTIRFHPVAGGVTESLLSIITNDNFTGTFYLNLSGSGIGQNHSFEVYRNNTIMPVEASIDYGDPSAPQEIETLLRLKNTGNMPLKINSIFVTGDTAAFYATGRSMTLKPGNNQTIPVLFRVTDTLSRTAFLNISTNHPGNPLYRIKLTAWPEMTALEQLVENKLTIYPNPAGDEVNVALGYGRITGYRLTDLQGKRVAEKQVSATRLLTLNPLRLAPGIYLMEVTSESGKKYKGKVVKLKD